MLVKTDIKLNILPTGNNSLQGNTMRLFRPFTPSNKKLGQPQKLLIKIRWTSSYPDDREYFLKRLSLKEEDLIWPKTAKKNAKTDYWTINPASTEEMYGKSNLAQLAIFKGEKEGFINFGYWQPGLVVGNKLNEKQREDASKALYRKIAEEAQLTSNSRVLDVGCGQGRGCRYLMKKYELKEVTGIDISKDQISRAKKLNKDIISRDPTRFKLMMGDATKMPFDGPYTNVISVEAIQHVDTEKFIKESRRVLEPGGSLHFATFFSTNEEGRAAIRALIPDYPTHCNEATIREVKANLDRHLIETKVESIGYQVFPGLLAWLKTIGFDNQWTILWPKLYEEGWVNYFLIGGKSPDSPSDSPSSPIEGSSIRLKH